MLKNSFFSIFVFSVVMFLTPVFFAQGATLSLTNAGTGVDQTVTVESSGQFRLVFEAGDNWGLAQWYDLVNDSTAQRNLASSTFSHFSEDGSNEAGLYQQVWYGTTPDDPKLFMRAAKYFPNNSSRSFTVLENTSARVVVQSVSSPIIWNQALSNIVTTMTYYIYPDGKIYVNSATKATNAQTANIWSNPVIGLADPFYVITAVNSTSTAVSTLTLTDNTKLWTANQWVGYWLTQPNYHHWNILSNTADTLTVAATGNTLVVGAYQIGATPYKYGWVRWTDSQDPYNWSAQAPKYIFEYWDPTTPAPYNNWAKASILLVPSPNNPSAYAGKANNHDWTGFKRFRLDSASITIAAGQTVSQDFLIQLGAKNSSVLPDLSSAAACNPIANAYIANITPPATSTSDLIAPSVPANLHSTNVTSALVDLAWDVSTDNVGVVGYKIYRNGTQIGTSTTASYTDNTVGIGATYNYTVAAYDNARNTSAVSSVLNINMTAPAGMYYWFENNSVKIRQDAVIKNQPSFQIKSAKNEFEPFQLAIKNNGSSAETQLDVEISDFSGAGGTISKDNVTIMLEKYINVTHKSDDEGVLGEWPDILCPKVDAYFHETRNFFPFSIAPGRIQPIWFDFFVPTTTVAGNYSATVTVKQSGVSIFSGQVNLTVWNFSLPVTSSFNTQFGLGYDSAYYGHYGNIWSQSNSSDKITTLLRLYRRALLRHRITSDPENISFTGWNGISYASVNTTRFNASIKDFFGDGDPGVEYGRSQLTMISMDFGNLYQRYAVFSTPTLCSGTAKTSTPPQALLDEVYARALAIYNVLTPAQRAITYILPVDEPGGGEVGCGGLNPALDFNAVKAMAEKIHQAGLKVRVTSQRRPELLDLLENNTYIDVWIPSFNALSGRYWDGSDVNTRSSYDTDIVAGAKLWWYESCMTSGCAITGGPLYNGYVQYMPEFPAMQNRAFQWLAYKFDVSGELYWGTVAGYYYGENGNNTGDPWYSLWNKYWSNGDGTFFYPGVANTSAVGLPSAPDGNGNFRGAHTPSIGGIHDIPIESFRLKMLREGMEDYEYMNLLKQLGDSQYPKTLMNGIVTNNYTFSKNPDDYFAIRAAMANRILALQATSSDVTPPTGSVSINSNAAYTNNISTLLTLLASDVSGVTQMKLSDISTNFSSLTALSFSSPYSWTLLGLDGVKTVYAWFADSLGNWNNTPFSDTIILDRVSPDITNINVANISANSATLTWNTSELSVSSVDYGLTSGYGQSTTEETTPITTHSTILSGLSSATNYNFRINATDRAGNRSVSINQTFRTASTSIPDIIPPAQITNLSVNNIQSTSADLHWTATGDDNNTGLAKSYAIKYSTTAISDTNTQTQIKNWWNSASLISQSLIPKLAGQSEVFTVLNLDPSATYYFAIQALDEANNTSTISNIINLSTPATPVVTPPSNGGGGGGGSSSGGGGGSSSGSLSSTTNSTESPSHFLAIGAKNQVYLSWSNPINTNFVGVKLYRKLNSALTSQTDAQGKMIYQGTQEQFNDLNIPTSSQYYYTLYAYNRSSHYSNPVTVSATLDQTKQTITIPAPLLTKEGVGEVATPASGVAGGGQSGRTSLVGVKSSEVETITKAESKTLTTDPQTVPLTPTTAKIYQKIVALAERQLDQTDKYTIANFIHYGTPTTIITGAGERGGSIASFRSAFGRLPETATDWQDVIKIANGRWPSQRNISAEAKVQGNTFAKIYGRTANLKNTNDSNAVTVMTYGLRPAIRNAASEKAAIKAFRYVFHVDPTSASDWDVVRAIAYSGAKR